jgi:ubiquinone/menaquinone biosynthesis C-methylase UbiE
MTGEFADQYLELRLKENRLYSDEEVKRLPLIQRSHPHFNEWKIRKRSARRLFRYLKKKKMPLKILEIGCGNGWLSALLAKHPSFAVIGTDINRFEIEQAERVFKSGNLKFILSQPDNILLNDKYDIILFAASIQYFSPLKKITELALSALNTGGEIHFIDTHFYHPGEIEAAKERTRNYYHEIGFPEMNRHYFHHSSEELQDFNYTYIRNKWLKTRFPWVIIKATKNVI